MDDVPLKKTIQEGHAETRKVSYPFLSNINSGFFVYFVTFVE